jgi:glucose/arabinose dehydrogenase
MALLYPAVFVLLLAATLAGAHQLCYDVTSSGILYTSPAPLSTIATPFCAANNVTCCSAAEDSALRVTYTADSNTLTATCRAKYLELVCAHCSPYEAHVFDAEGTSGPQAAPLLCTSFCDAYNAACAGQLPALACPATTSPYCYPVAVQDSTGAGFANAFPGFESTGLVEFRVHPLDRTRQWVATIDGLVYDLRYASNGKLVNRTVANLTSVVFNQGELGLLTFAFDPEYPAQPYVYIYYSSRLNDPLASGNNRINYLSRFTMTSAGDLAREVLALDSECKILVFFKDGWNHNGGDLIFDSTGALFLTVGDGAPQRGNGNAQTMHMLFGKIVRIRPRKGVCQGGVLIDPVTPEVARQPISLNYDIPADNPYASDALYPTIRPEIWAHGFRNPWSCSLEQPGDRLYCGDVGQTRFEEMDRIVRGGDYGWEIMEGDSCFASDTTLCDAKVLQANYRPPMYVYPHFPADLVPGESLIGYCIIYGHKYLGTAVPSLRGKFIFGDNWAGVFGALVDNGSERLSGAEQLKVLAPQVSRVRRDGNNETVLLIIDFARPNYILKLIPSATQYCGNGICELGEACDKCPSDCRGVLTGPRASKWCCADGTCKSGTCPDGACTTSTLNPRCGNALCESGETCETCAYDCPGRKGTGNLDQSYCCVGDSVNGPACVPYVNTSTICTTKVDPCGRGNKSGPGNGQTATTYDIGG